MTQWHLWGFTSFFIGMAILDIVFKLLHVRRRGAVRWRVGTTLYNHLIAGVLLGWLIFIVYQAGGLPANLPFAIAVLVFGLLGAIPPLTFRENGLSNAYFRLGWSEVQEVAWQGNKLVITPKGKLFHPNRLIWQIPDHKVTEIREMLESTIATHQVHLDPNRD